MYILFCFFIGLCAGSFSNVVIYRLPKMMLGIVPDKQYNLAIPRSHCPACQHTLGVLHLIPLMSWSLLRGRCYFCNVKIPIIYPSVELATGLIYLSIAFYIPELTVALAFSFFCTVLIILSFIDFRHMLLPDVLTLPLLWAGLLLSCTGYGFLNERQAILGAVTGYLSLWVCYWLYRLFRKQEGLGYGDLKLNAALGAWLGIEGVHFILLAGPLLGILIWFYHRRRVADNIISFGPALSGSAILYLFYSIESVFN